MFRFTASCSWLEDDDEDEEEEESPDDTDTDEEESSEEDDESSSSLPLLAASITAGRFDLGMVTDSILALPCLALCL